MSHSQNNQEENTWVIPDYDPWLELQIAEFQEAEEQKPQEVQQSSPETKHISAVWFSLGCVALIAGTIALAPKVIQVFSHHDKPAPPQDEVAIDNQLNRKYLRPRLMSSARKVVKFAAKHPEVSNKYLSEDTVTTVIAGQSDGDMGKIRLVTERHGDSRRVEASSALSLGVVHKSDDGAGNRLFESVLVAAPSGEANMWLAQERTSYASSGNRPLNDQRSSTGGESSLIAADTKSILDDAMFAIEFDPKLSRVDP
ncbi:MAG: hypothetical protein AAB436_03860 [Patescibacteria group bacterium]